MKLSKKKKTALFITIAVLCALVLAFVIYLVVGYMIRSRAYSIAPDEWEETPYMALEYGKYLGKPEVEQGFSHRYSAIKGLDEDEWLYDGKAPFWNIGRPDWVVLRRKDVAAEPIKDWPVKEILITGLYHDDFDNLFRVDYSSVDGKITDEKIISALTDAVNGSTADWTLPYEAIREALFTFEGHPGIALRARVCSLDGKYYLCIGDRYYPADALAESEEFLGIIN